MLQKKFFINGINELREKLPEFKGAFCDFEYNDGVIDMFFANIPEDEVVEVQRLLKQEFPKLKITGMSARNILQFYGKDRLISLNFTLMNEATAVSFFRGISWDSEQIKEKAIQYAKELNEKIRQLKDVKCIEVYLAWINASGASFIDMLSDGLEDIPIYGAIADVNMPENAENIAEASPYNTAVVCDDNLGPGISIVVYCGSDLYVYAEYLFGWEPIGRYMTIDHCKISKDGKTSIYSMDGESPIDVYDKYLGVKPDRAFVANICEFPLIVERNGVYLGRTPTSYGENGEVFLEGDIIPGEKVRFSYGEYNDILNGTKNAAMRMHAFGAEALSLVICGNRIIFFQKNYHVEIDYYAEGQKEEPIITLGLGEIYKYKGQGGILNSALVAVGMREGLKEKISGEVLKPSVVHQYDDYIPLAERLSHFLKAVAEDLIDAVIDARSANEAKSAFLSNMSHEIRTPINAILGMDEMILRESTEDEIIGYAENIRSAGNSLLGIVNNILDFSKIEAGKIEIIPVEYEFASVLNDLINMIKKRADDKGLELIVNVDHKIPHLLFGDELRLKQVTTNILTNAVKYTEKGSISLSVSVKEFEGDSVVLEISVKDSGIGIKEEDMSKLFSAFERIEERRNRTTEGTGLGMSITQSLLKMMGTSLQVESVYGEGSTFHFDIRQKIIDPAPLGNFEDALKRSISARKAYHESFTAPEAEILVVDDTEMNLTVIKNLLKKTLVKIDTAISCDECISMMTKKKYDLVFLDHRMPGKDGIETLNEIKKDSKIDHTIPIVALTANAVSGSRDIYMNAGFSDYLSKPIDTTVLEGIMVKFLPANKVTKTYESSLGNNDSADISCIPEIIRNSQIFDVSAAEANCGSPEAYIQALKTYYDSAKENAEVIKEFFEKGDLSNYTIKVHALKSTSRIIGLKELGKLAEELENAGNTGDTKKIREETMNLLNMYKDASDLIGAAFVEKTEESAKEIIEKEKLDEAYNAMREFAQMFDYDSIVMVLDSISKYEVVEDEKRRFEELKRAIRNADWDEITRILG